MITQQLKAIENLNIVDIKCNTIEHPKTSHKLSKTVRQAEKASQVGSGKVLIARYTVKRGKTITCL